MSELFVEARHLFDERFTLDVKFTVPPGITVLKGPSGAGKTTTLEIIAGLFTPAFCDLRLGAKSLTGLKPEERHVSLVFQSLALFPHLTVRQNIEFGAAPSDATYWLNAMQIAHVSHRKPASLSGGEAQRAALARAMARKPQVLLLDEPFSALDDALRESLLNEVSAHIDTLRIPALLVTHDARDAAVLGARTLTLSQGTIAAATAL